MESSTQAFLKSSQEPLDDITWHVLDELYFTNKINISKEKKLLTSHDRIIFQFPLYWYSSPFLLKKWEDEVLTRSFTYLEEEGQLKQKEFGMVITTGSSLKSFQVGGRENFSISQLTIPYQALAKRSGMKFLSPFVIHQFNYMNDIEKEKLLINYQMYLTEKNPSSFSRKQEWIIDKLRKLSTQKRGQEKEKLNLIISKIIENKDELESLDWQLALIKKKED